MACPHCGTRLNQGCGKCGRALQAGWAFCPYCAATTAPKSAKRLGGKKQRELPPSNVAEFKNQNR